MFSLITLKVLSLVKGQDSKESKVDSGDTRVWVVWLNSSDSMSQLLSLYNSHHVTEASATVIFNVRIVNSFTEKRSLRTMERLAWRGNWNEWMKRTELRGGSQEQKEWIHQCSDEWVEYLLVFSHRTIAYDRVERKRKDRKEERGGEEKIDDDEEEPSSSGIWRRKCG